MQNNPLTNFSKTFNCRGRLLVIEKPIVMGILNITPDSFFEGSRAMDEKLILLQTEKMLAEGATIIDVGGQSTRPNAELILADEELKRVVKPIEKIKKEFPNCFISVDTFYAKVAHDAVLAGADIVNDISNGSMDEQLLATVADLKVPYILMHSKGTPENMQQHSVYENLAEDIFKFFTQKIHQLNQLGIHDLILDIGFGFAKTIEQNFELLQHLDEFKILQKPLMVGISRKSMIWKILNTTPENSLNGTTVLNTIALQKGASILRVHDVKAAVEAIKLVAQIKKN